jgi:hypothetical protein
MTFRRYFRSEAISARCWRVAPPRPKARSGAQCPTRITEKTQRLDQRRGAGKDDKSDLDTWRVEAKAAGWEPELSFRASAPLAEVRRQQADWQRFAYEAALPFLADPLEHKALTSHHDVRSAAFRRLIATGIKMGDCGRQYGLQSGG